MFEIKLIFYGLSRMLQFSEFVWAPSYSIWDVFNKFLLMDATDRSKISCDQKRLFIALGLYPLSFFANTPFNFRLKGSKWKVIKLKHSFQWGMRNVNEDANTTSNVRFLQWDPWNSGRKTNARLKLWFEWSNEHETQQSCSLYT